MLEREGEESSIGLSLNGDMRSEIIDNYGNNEKSYLSWKYKND